MYPIYNYLSLEDIATYLNKIPDDLYFFSHLLERKSESLFMGRIYAQKLTPYYWSIVVRVFIKDIYIHNSYHIR